MVSAWCSEYGLVLGQEKTADKSNEIKAIPELLNVLDIKGCTVTIDSMGCQKGIAEKMIKQKADYVLALKGNQKKLFSEVKDYFERAVSSNFKRIAHDDDEERSKGHGREAHRQCWVLPITPKQCSHVEDWPNLRHIVMVTGHRVVKNKTTCDPVITLRQLSSPMPRRSYRLLDSIGILKMRFIGCLMSLSRRMLHPLEKMLLLKTSPL